MILIEGLTDACGEENLFSGVNLQVKPREACVLYGNDGVGKTTLFHIIMGFETRYTGKVQVLGTYPNQLTEAQRGYLRFVPDDLIWEDGMTAGDYFCMADAASARYKVAIQKVLCEMFGINLSKAFKEMSEEENKLVQIAAALAACPKLLILDEPGNFLSDAKRRIVMQCLNRFGGSGLSVLLAVEKREDTCGYGDQFFLLKDGKVYTSGSKR